MKRLTNTLINIDKKLTPVQKIRTLAIYISRSPKRVAYWKYLIQQINESEINLDHQQFIPYDVCTRWNSTFRMIEAAINMKNVYIEFVKVNILDDLIINKTEWDWLDQLCKILKKFNDRTLTTSTAGSHIFTNLYEDIK